MTKHFILLIYGNLALSRHPCQETSQQCCIFIQSTRRRGKQSGSSAGRFSIFPFCSPKVSVFPGRHFHNPLKHTVEKLLILIPHRLGDLSNPHITARQKPAALLYSDLLQIFTEGKPCLLPENPADIGQGIVILQNAPRLT